MRRYLSNIVAKQNKMYIHEHNNWTNFHWKSDDIALLLDEVTREQGKLYGRLSSLGFDSQLQAMAENLTHDVVYSSEIEGIQLNADEVRSSIARRLGLENIKYTTPSHYVDAVVAVMLEATEHYGLMLTKQKLCAWQSAFFPTGFSEGSQIEIGKYRTHEEHVVSGYLGRERIHYIAPSPERVEEEMKHFMEWFNSEKPISPVIRSAIAHFWFVSIHPFEDGNGRLARILGDMFLARGDKSRFRFYNISSEINRDKNHYYQILERIFATSQPVRSPNSDSVRLVHVQERVVLPLQITQLLQVCHVTIHAEYGFRHDKYIIVFLPMIKQNFPQMFVI